MERYFNGCSIENFELGGKVAVITDGNTEFGKNYAIALARAGVKLIIQTQDTKWDEVRRLIEKEGQEVIFVQGHIEDNQCRERIIQIAKQVYGKVDILINNIEVIIKKPLFIFDNEYYNEIIDSRISAAYEFIKQVREIMKENNCGKIINIMRTDSLFGKCRFNNSSISVEKMTTALSKELVEDNIQVNCISNIGKETNPVEVARTIVFLSSSISDNVNGDVISCN